MNNRQQLLRGFIGGMLAPAFILLMIYAARFGNNTIMEFVHTAIKQKVAAPFIALSLLANLALFFLFLKFDRFYASRGVILATFIYGSFIVYFKVFT